MRRSLYTNFAKSDCNLKMHKRSKKIVAISQVTAEKFRFEKNTVSFFKQKVFWGRFCKLNFPQKSFPVDTVADDRV